MRKIVRNLLILIAICTAFLVFKKGSYEGFLAAFNLGTNELCNSTTTFTPYISESLRGKTGKGFNKAGGITQNELLSADNGKYFCAAPKFTYKTATEKQTKISSLNPPKCLGGFKPSFYQTCPSNLFTSAKPSGTKAGTEFPCFVCEKA